MIRGIGPVYARKLVKAFGAKVFDVIEADQGCALTGRACNGERTARFAQEAILDSVPEAPVSAAAHCLNPDRLLVQFIRGEGQPMRSARTEAFWQAFRCHIGADDPRHQVTYFRTSPEATEKLIAMIVAGAMRAVAGVMHYFGEGREEPLPTTGDYALLLDSRRRPRLIWRTTGVSVGPLSSVSTHHVWADGLGRGDRETWLAIHRRGFARQARMYRFEMHDDIETMFEEFEVVWPDSVARRLKLVVPQLERGFALHQHLDEHAPRPKALRPYWVEFRLPF